MQTQLAKETSQLPVGKKSSVAWGVGNRNKFPQGIVISEYARVRILTLRVRWNSQEWGKSVLRQNNNISLEICDAPWRISVATIRRRTFTCMLN